MCGIRASRPVEFIPKKVSHPILIGLEGKQLGGDHCT